MSKLQSAEEKATLARERIEHRRNQIEAAVVEGMQKHAIFDLDLDLFPEEDGLVKVAAKKHGLRAETQTYIDTDTCKEFLCATIGSEDSDFDAFEAER